MIRKPMIRHCFNCEYGQAKGSYKPKYGYCDVKYTTIKRPRIIGMLCRHYKEKVGE